MNIKIYIKNFRWYAVRGCDNAGRGIAFGKSFFVLAVCLMPIAAMANGQPADIDGAKAVLEKWVETRRIISKEKQDMALATEVLNQRIDLAQNEIHSIEEKIKDAQASIDLADKKREEMIAENDKLKEASTMLSTTADVLEAKTKELLKRLPDPIRERVKPLSQRLPEDAANTKLSVGERFQNVVGILNEVDKFNRAISVLSEVRLLDDGRSVEVATMYIGISQAYYVSADGKIAGIGTSSAEGWIWKADNQAATQIAEAISILNNEKAASFVQLPIEIK